MRAERFKIPYTTCIEVENGGFFSSRGRGSHPHRVLKSCELILVRKGSLKLQEETRRFLLKPGEALVLLPERFHKGIGGYPAGLEFYWVHFRISAPRVGNAVSDELLVPQHITLANPDRLEELFRQFLHDQETGQLTPCKASAYVLLMLTQMDPSKRNGHTKKDLTLHANRVDQYIRTHFHESVNAAGIADHFKLNVDYIGRLYKQAFGVTITEGIRHERLKKAREYLLHSDANISEIALECGFADQAHFSRSFKKQAGLTPGQYRKCEK